MVNPCVSCGWALVSYWYRHLQKPGVAMDTAVAGSGAWEAMEVCLLHILTQPLATLAIVMLLRNDAQQRHWSSTWSSMH